MTDITKLIEDFDLRFTSGNSIPIDRIWLTKEMWTELRAALEKDETK